MASSYTPFGLSTHESYGKLESCGRRCICEKCCAKIEQKIDAKKSWEEAEHRHFKLKSDQLKRAQEEKATIEDSKRISKLKTVIAELQNCLSEVKRMRIHDYKRIANYETQIAEYTIEIAELKKRVSELQLPSASPPHEKRSYMIRGILY